MLLENGNEWVMPLIAAFLGIIVRMYWESGGQHKAAHVHAQYGGSQIVISLTGRVLDGKFPKRQLRILTEWMDEHKAELRANWELAKDQRPLFKITEA